jgi:periplasmic protein CpxP/Spy
MKRSARMLVAVLAAGVLGYGVAAFAAEGTAEPCGHHHGMVDGKPAKFMQKRMDALHEKLKLSAEQETAWKTWTDSMRERFATMAGKRPNPADMDKLPAPQRMERHLAMMKEAQAQMEAGLADLQAFYGKLTPEQQATFDKEFKFPSHRGGPRHRRG